MSGACIIEAMAFHFPSGLDVEVGKMAQVFAMSANNLAAGMALCHEGSGGHLKTLFLVIMDEILLVLNGPDNSVRREGGIVI